MRVATYTRISTDEEHQPYSLDAQATRLGSYIASQEGWDLTRQFTDSMTGATTERPGLQRMLSEARAGRFDLLLVYRVDRFSRSVRGLAQLLEELDRAGVAFRSATEPFDTTTPAGRMMVQMLGVFAEFERATIVDRVIAGLERKAARGEWAAGGPPYGYRIDKATGHLVVAEDEAPLVGVVFDLYLAKRMGARAIANWLNDRGHRTKYGRPWSHASVLTVLGNRTYTGQVFFRDTWHPAPHSPLVDADTFAAAQEVRIGRGEDRSKRASTSSAYLLSGLVVCASCGKRYVGNVARGSRHTYRYYTCFSRQRYGARTCGSERLPAEELDAKVAAALLDLYERSDLFQRAADAGRERAREQRGRLEAELAAVEADLKKGDDAIERYLLAFEAGTLTDDVCRKRLDAIAARASDLRGRRSQLLVAMEDEPAAPTKAHLTALRARIESALSRGTMNERKALMQALVHEIKVESRANIVPTFRFPPGLADPDGKVRALAKSAPSDRHGSKRKRPIGCLARVDHRGGHANQDGARVARSGSA
jgi:site-specific DNA recombinase